MKNAKLLIPAVAVLALSSAAAVTGTVAWFTATRSQKLTASSVTVVNTEGGLKIAGAAGVGTSAAPNSDSTTITHNGVLRDGSVDISTGKVWGAVLDSDGNTSDVTAQSFKEVTDFNPTNSEGTVDSKPVYKAHTYKLTFSLKGKVGAKNYGVYLNGDTSVTKATGVNATFMPALRVGLKSSTQHCVVAPDTSVSGPLTYVNAASIEGQLPTYSSGDSLATRSKIETKNNDSANYLGEINGPDGSLEVTVYTWLEGTDEHVTSENWADAANLVFGIELGFNIIEQ